MRACSFRRLAAAVCAAAVCAGLAGLAGCAAGGPASRTDFFMSTLVTQQAYGPRAEDALAQAADTLREWEARLSTKRTATSAASMPPRAHSPCR